MKKAGVAPAFSIESREREAQCASDSAVPMRIE